jgi:hypothetical protein
MFCPSCGKELPHGSSFCLQCGKPTTATAATAATPATDPKRSGLSSAQKLGIAILLVLAAVYFVRSLGQSSTPASPAFASNSTPVHTPVLVPGSTKLFTGQIVVKAGGYVTNTFTVEPGMQNFHVIGQFNASGGSGNDIQAVLADEGEFQNWINGHQAKTFYSTEKITTGKLDVGPLGPGRYVIALSNRFSAFSEKQVFAEVEARWVTQQ